MLCGVAFSHAIVLVLAAVLVERGPDVHAHNGTGDLALWHPSSTDRRWGPCENAHRRKGAERPALVRADKANGMAGGRGGHVHHYALHGGHREDVELLECGVQQLFVLLGASCLLRPELAAICTRTPPADPRQRTNISKCARIMPVCGIEGQDSAKGGGRLARSIARTFAANPRYCAWPEP